jgi:LasA protease
VRRAAALAFIVIMLTVSCHRNAPSPSRTPQTTEGVVAPDSATVAPGAPIPTSQPDVSPTPYASAMPLPTPQGELFEAYVVQPGDTLGGISLAFDVSINELVDLNGLESEAAIIHVGQTLQVPVTVARSGPQTILLPDSEVVLSPTYVGFNTEDFVQQQGGYLADFTAPVDGVHVSGAQIIDRVARQNSVGPRVLLALMEHYGGWVTQPQPSSYQPFGPANAYHDESFLLQVGWGANQVNEGYYGYKRRGDFPVSFSDGSRAMVPNGVNAGSAGIWNILAANANWETWEAESADFMDTYRRLFGDPETRVFEPIVPSDLVQPALQLPWDEGATFYYTGGPHAAYYNGTAWAALDFAPPDILGNCFYSGMDITAAADGRVILAEDGETYLDLDGDGNLETGWVLLYLHLGANDSLSDGELVSAGTALGYASCEGGYATESHLHLARRYNGEWMAADGPVPFVLAGWQFHAGAAQYDGTATRGGVTKTACNCADDALNALVGE